MAPRERPSRRSKPEKPQGPVNWRSAESTSSAGQAGQFSIFRWKQQESGTKDYWLRLWFLLGTICLLLLALVIYVTRSYQQVPFVCFTLTRYDDRLILPNSYAYEDAERFYAEWQSDDAGLLNRVHCHFVGESRRDGRVESGQFLNLLEDDLGKIQPGGPGKDIALIYVSAHSAVNGKGEPCLLMSDSGAWDTDSWVPLDDLLKVLELRASEDYKIALFLDGNRVDQNLRIGLLHNSFADQIDDVVARHRNPHLVIVNAASPGEIAWSAPELQGTAFGYYLAQGLIGHGAKNSRITLGGLLDYVELKLEAWARNHRASRQRPLVVAAGGDDQWREWLIAKNIPKPASDEQAGDYGKPGFVSQRADQLTQIYRQLDGGIRADAASTAPRDLSLLQFQLQRLEQLLLAGQAANYVAEFSDAEREVRGLLTALQSQDGGPRAVGLSAFAGRSGAQAEATDQFLQRWRAAPDVDTWMEESKGQEQPAFPYAVMARGGLQWLAEDFSADTQDQTAGADLIKLLDTVYPSLDEIDFSEMHNLRRLQRVPASAQPRVPQAVLTRLLAERTALPSDARGHYWIQSLVNEADQSRRYAEDHLFVGEDAELTRGRRLSEQANERYEQAEERTKAVSDAYAVRDLAYAWLPYLTEWTLRRARLDPKSVTAGDVDKLGQLARKVHVLGAALDADFDPLRRREPLDVALAESVNDQLGELAREFDRWWDVWANNVDQSAVGPWQLLLETPLIGLGETGAIGRSNGLRQQLLETIFVEYEQDDTTDAVADAQTASQGKRAEPPDYLFELLLEAEQHPLLSILARQTNESVSGAVELRGDTELDRIRYISAVGQQVRESLERVSRGARTDPGENNPHAGRRVRLPVARADRLERAAMPLLGAAKSQSLRATNRLSQLDRHFLKLWHANRMLEDFWAGYFELAAERLLDSPEQYMRYGSEHIRDKQDRLVNLVAQRRVVPPQCPSSARADADKRYHIDVTLRKTPGVPAGLATISFRPPGARREIQFAIQPDPGRFDRLGMPVSLGGEAAGDPKQCMIRASDAGPLTRIEARTWFRGHQGVARIELPHIGPGQPIVTIEREEPLPATVTVHPTTKQLERIVLILDASGSMTDPFSESNKWHGALSAVNGLLHTLVRLPESNYELALVVYGHRAGWKKDKRPVVGYSPSYQREIDGRGAVRIHPNQDVEPIRLGRSEFTTFKEETVRSLNDRLRDRNEFAPRGQTPLHFAISRAIDMLRAQPKPEIALRNRIILVTDGKNDIVNVAFESDEFKAIRKELEQHYAQFKPESPIVERIRDLRRSRSMDLSIDIIGVDYNNKIDLDGEARYTNASNAKQLLRELERSAGLYGFAVHNHRGTELGAALVGQPVEINQLGERNKQHSVTVDTADDVTPHEIELEGGEKIELYHNPTLGRLEHQRYEPGLAKKGECHDHYVSALYPKRDNNRVDFAITIQNNDEALFSPRPMGFWATVKPTGRGASGVYHFSDMKFVVDTPVPVLELTVPNWPRGITEAEIECWIRFGEDIEPHVESVSPGRQFKVRDLPGVKFRLDVVNADDGLILRVEESVEESVEKLQLARVVAKPVPAVISRQLFPGRGKLVHEFHYRGLARPTKVEITPLAQIKRQYVGLVEPIHVTLQD